MHWEHCFDAAVFLVHFWLLTPHVSMHRRCTHLRLRLLGPGSNVPSVGIGRVILRVDRSAAPPPPAAPLDTLGNSATNGDGNEASGRLDMGKVEALIGHSLSLPLTVSASASVCVCVCV